MPSPAPSPPAPVVPPPSPLPSSPNAAAWCVIVLSAHVVGGDSVLSHFTACPDCLEYARRRPPCRRLAVAVAVAARGGDSRPRASPPVMYARASKWALSFFKTLNSRKLMPSPLRRRTRTHARASAPKPTLRVPSTETRSRARDGRHTTPRSKGRILCVRASRRRHASEERHADAARVPRRGKVARLPGRRASARAAVRAPPPHSARRAAVDVVRRLGIARRAD